ncbi:putative reverse transcriptase domain-containing protein [Tanacetum coccineum]
MSASQNEAIKEENAPAEMLHGLDQQMEKNEDRHLYFMDRIWIPLIGDLRTMIMDEEHTTRYSIHLGADKMYYDLRDMYRWPDTLRACVIDFDGSWDTHLPLAEFSYNNGYHSSIRCAPFEALYRRKCRSHVLWAEVGENRLIGPKMVQETIDKVKCLANANMHVPLEEVMVEKTLSFVEEPVEIMDRED